MENYIAIACRNKFKFAFFISICILFVLAFYPVWSGLIKVWMNSDEYSHGFFIVPIALFVVWNKRSDLTSSPVQGSWIGLLLVILALFIYLIGRVGEIYTLSSLSMIFFIAASIVFLFGFRIFKELLFPLFILLFMIPVPSQVFSAATIELQLFVSQASTFLVSFLGVPLFREGNVIHLPERTLQVVQACSGLRSLITLLTLSAVFGYFTLRSNILRTVLFFSGVPIAIFVNIVRVTLLICFIHFLGLDLTHGASHTWFGLGIFALALGLLFLIKGLIARWDTFSLVD